MLSIITYIKDMKFFITTLFLIFNLITTTSLFAGDILKWIDEEGRVHYGDSAPQQFNSEKIKTSKRPSNIGKPLPRMKKSSENDNKTSSESEDASPQSLNEEQAKVACDNARKDIAVINSSDRIQLRSADGSLRYMTKAEINKRLERSNQEIKRYCR